MNICAYTEVGDSFSTILLPLFFNSSSGVNVAKLVHRVLIGTIFIGKQHVCSYFSLHTYHSTKWLHCLLPDVLLPSLQLHEYAHTCAHLPHFKSSFLGNHCESDQCVYDISDSELALELNLELLTLTSVTPLFYWELLSVHYCIWSGEILVVWSVRGGENKWQLLDQIISSYKIKMALLCQIVVCRCWIMT